MASYSGTLGTFRQEMTRAMTATISKDRVSSSNSMAFFTVNDVFTDTMLFSDDLGASLNVDDDDIHEDMDDDLFYFDPEPVPFPADWMMHSSSDEHLVKAEKCHDAPVLFDSTSPYPTQTLTDDEIKAVLKLDTSCKWDEEENETSPDQQGTESADTQRKFSGASSPSVQSSQTHSEKIWSVKAMSTPVTPITPEESSCIGESLGDALHKAVQDGKLEDILQEIIEGGKLEDNFRGVVQDGNPEDTLCEVVLVENFEDAFHDVHDGRLGKALQAHVQDKQEDNGTRTSITDALDLAARPEIDDNVIFTCLVDAMDVPGHDCLASFCDEDDFVTRDYLEQADLTDVDPEDLVVPQVSPADILEPIDWEHEAEEMYESNEGHTNVEDEDEDGSQTRMEMKHRLDECRADMVVSRCSNRHLSVPNAIMEEEDEEDEQCLTTDAHQDEVYFTHINFDPGADTDCLKQKALLELVPRAWTPNLVFRSRWTNEAATATPGSPSVSSITLKGADEAPPDAEVAMATTTKQTDTRPVDYVGVTLTLPSSSQASSVSHTTSDQETVEPPDFSERKQDLRESLSRSSSSNHIDISGYVTIPPRVEFTDLTWSCQSTAAATRAYWWYFLCQGYKMERQKISRPMMVEQDRSTDWFFSEESNALATTPRSLFDARQVQRPQLQSYNVPVGEVEAPEEHHRNYYGEPVYHPGISSREVQVWAQMTKAVDGLQRTLRQDALLRSAWLTIEPWYEIFPPTSLPPGNKGLSAVGGQRSLWRPLRSPLTSCETVTEDAAPALIGTAQETGSEMAEEAGEGEGGEETPGVNKDTKETTTEDVVLAVRSALVGLEKGSGGASATAQNLLQRLNEVLNDPVPAIKAPEGRVGQSSVARSAAAFSLMEVKRRHEAAVAEGIAGPSRRRGFWEKGVGAALVRVGHFVGW
ncbi:MAG: hypothetical protein M1833_005630 [Piccolia ochrophora]|nr:MAG: hypothetical protein M1833_005630 [Piccolia ochrophora]